MENNNDKNKKRKSMIKSKDKKNKNLDSNNLLSYKSQSNKNTNSATKLEKQDSIFKDHLSSNYNKELINKFSIFLQTKKFKISNEFDAKNSKKFLDKKNKYLEKIILTDIIEKNENNIKNSEQINKRGDRRKSGTQNNNNIKNYFIVVTNYDDETQNEKKYNFSVKPQSRKLNNIKKNKNLSKYFSNNNNNSQTSERAKSEQSIISSFNHYL